MPFASSLACDKPQNIGRVRVGCPPTRKLRVSFSQFANCDDFKPGGARHKYTVPGSVSNRDFSGTASAVDQQLEYDYAKLGCPLRVFYGVSSFLPRFDIYDGETKISSLNADYVIWDTNGRFDITYNATALDVGCSNNPQTWDQQLAKSNKNPDSAWSRSSYQSCFTPYKGQQNEADRNTELGQIRYNILNATGYNALRFIQRDGMFIFKARVVDPSVSYCELEIEFGVEVYGGPLNELVTTLALLGTIVIILLALTCSYYMYRRRYFSFDKPKED
eukprot:TRINITY_DN850_c1_g1_i1.p1 TRINITY_DN850_c1_g1~~TRINITY_DN850_c1_g1_i1.p1  ORF type:complete len:276 (+),score=69.39 TRINITY_DN850_c1_g1_i1:412-1239(+)